MQNARFVLAESDDCIENSIIYHGKYKIHCTMKAMTGSSTNACAKTAGIADELPGIPVIGNTSFTGDITPERFWR